MACDTSLQLIDKAVRKANVKEQVIESQDSMSAKEIRQKARGPKSDWGFGAVSAIHGPCFPESLYIFLALCSFTSLPHYNSKLEPPPKSKNSAKNSDYN